MSAGKSQPPKAMLDGITTGRKTLSNFTPCYVKLIFQFSILGEGAASPSRGEASPTALLGTTTAVAISILTSSNHPPCAASAVQQYRLRSSPQPAAQLINNQRENINNSNNFPAMEPEQKQDREKIHPEFWDLANCKKVVDHPPYLQAPPGPQCKSSGESDRYRLNSPDTVLRANQCADNNSNQAILLHKSNNLNNNSGHDNVNCTQQLNINNNNDDDDDDDICTSFKIEARHVKDVLLVLENDNTARNRVGAVTYDTHSKGPSDSTTIERKYVDGTDVTSTRTGHEGDFTLKETPCLMTERGHGGKRRGYHCTQQ